VFIVKREFPGDGYGNFFIESKNDLIKANSDLDKRTSNQKMQVDVISKSIHGNLLK